VCAGCGGNSDFPTTPLAISSTNNSPNCNNALFKIDFELSAPVISKFVVSPNRGCGPLTVSIQDFSINADTYYWDFGNGQSSTSPNPGPITYPQPGVYTITLVVSNPFSCNLSDTIRRLVVVRPTPSATFQYQISCRTVSFTADEPYHTIYE